MIKNLKDKAIKLRKRGYSYSEVAQKLGIVKSTAFVWLRGVSLGNAALGRLEKRVRALRLVGLQEIRKQRQEKVKIVLDKCRKIVDNVTDSEENRKLACALLYWCEGEKKGGAVRFTNSDPVMIQTFLNLFRQSFKLDESKFRICLHLHSYHNQQKQKKFWSGITNIPVEQFQKIYTKPNQGKNKKKDYQGCVSLRYHDWQVAKEIEMIYKLFSQKHGGLV